jgi:hypothetical protein
MNIQNNYTHKFRFTILNNVSIEVMNRWEQFKKKCERGNNKSIVQEWKLKCKLKTNQDLPYLIRSEGGMGGDNNLIHKQIRFREVYNGHYKFVDNDILFDYIQDTKIEKWSYNELDDLLSAFCKIANNYVQADCVDGTLKLNLRVPS